MPPRPPAPLQRYFEALKTEKMLLLQLAAEDKECSFRATPSPRSTHGGRWRGGSFGGSGGIGDLSWGSGEMLTPGRGNDM